METELGRDGLGGVLAKCGRTSRDEGDGDLDLVVANVPRPRNANQPGLRILRNDGTGTFADETPWLVPYVDELWNVVLHDEDGDGDLDILAPGTETWWNDGSARFQGPSRSAWWFTPRHSSSMGR